MGSPSLARLSASPRLGSSFEHRPSTATASSVSRVSGSATNTLACIGGRPTVASFPLGSTPTESGRSAVAPLASPPRRALYAGRIHPTKGLDVVIRGLARSPSFHLSVAGHEDDPAYAARVRSDARALGVDSRISWLGHVSREEVLHLLGRMTSSSTHQSVQSRADSGFSKASQRVRSSSRAPSVLHVKYSLTVRTHSFSHRAMRLPLASAFSGCRLSRSSEELLLLPGGRRPGGSPSIAPLIP